MFDCGADTLSVDYGCALQRDILVQGRLYVSENHICFYANIFGWVTNLVIPVNNVSAIEKKLTAFVIPNAIGITDSTQKYTFASFLARDTAYDVIYSVWRNNRPGRASAGSPGSDTNLGMDSRRDSAFGSAHGEAHPAGKARRATQCACSKAGAHYNSTAMEVIFPGTPEQIYNLMFASGFIKDFLAQDQKLLGTSCYTLLNHNQSLIHSHRYPNVRLATLCHRCTLVGKEHVLHQATRR